MASKKVSNALLTGLNLVRARMKSLFDSLAIGNLAIGNLAIGDANLAIGNCFGTPETECECPMCGADSAAIRVKVGCVIDCVELLQPHIEVIGRVDQLSAS